MSGAPDGQGRPVPPSERSIRLDVPCDLAAMAAARSQVTEAATAWGFGAVAELEVVMSELLTNAIVHARSPALVRCSMDGAGGIDLEVSDRAGGDLTPQHVDDHSTHGRGLAIVEAFSDRWGTTHTPDDGKTVWAHLAGGPL